MNGKHEQVSPPPSDLISKVGPYRGDLLVTLRRVGVSAILSALTVAVSIAGLTVGAISIESLRELAPTNLSTLVDVVAAGAGVVGGVMVVLALVKSREAIDRRALRSQSRRGLDGFDRIKQDLDTATTELLHRRFGNFGGPV
ncbi:MAG: hypothetical protein ACKVT1_19060 [Dehalococcoidia bacterium]